MFEFDKIETKKSIKKTSKTEVSKSKTSKIYKIETSIFY